MIEKFREKVKGMGEKRILRKKCVKAKFYVLYITKVDQTLIIN